MEFKEKDYRHRFAVWCAATAARSSNKCRFKVEEGSRIIEKSSLKKLRLGWHELKEPKEFDQWHRETRKEIVRTAQGVLGNDYACNFTHGIAAKLINCYLKSMFLSSIQENLSEENSQKRDAIHPPIDRLLADELWKAAKGQSIAEIATQEQLERIKDKIQIIHERLRLTKKGKGGGWSSLNCDGYEEIIYAIKYIVGSEGLWTIEKFWPGHQ